MQQAKYKYGVAMSDYVRRPSLRLSEFMDLRMLREALRLDMFRSQAQFFEKYLSVVILFSIYTRALTFENFSQASHVRSFFKHPDLVDIMEWPVIFTT